MKKDLSELKKVVWEKIKTDMESKEVSQEQINFHQPYVEAIPEVLAEVLDETATLSSILKARLLYAEYIADSDYYKNSVEAMADELEGEIDIKEAITILKIESKIDLIRMRLEMQEIIMIETVLPLMDKSVHVNMSRFGLDKKNQRLLEKGKLNIGDLLKIIPEAFT